MVLKILKTDLNLININLLSLSYFRLSVTFNKFLFERFIHVFVLSSLVRLDILFPKKFFVILTLILENRLESMQYPSC